MEVILNKCKRRAVKVYELMSIKEGETIPMIYASDNSLKEGRGSLVFVTKGYFDDFCRGYNCCKFDCSNAITSGGYVYDKQVCNLTSVIDKSKNVLMALWYPTKSDIIGFNAILFEYRRRKVRRSRRNKDKE